MPISIKNVFYKINNINLKKKSHHKKIRIAAL